MASRLAILHPRGEIGLGKNPFGKDVANLELFRALAQHGGFDQIDMLSVIAVTEAHLIEGLIGASGSATRVVPNTALNQVAPREAGTLLRGQADLQNMAWLRRVSASDRAYSLMGIVHTLAPPSIRQTIAMSLAAPVHPWDAIICTSPAVKTAMTSMYDAWGDFLGERTGGGQPPRPALPVIPLGVSGAGFAALADRPEVRADLRGRLGVKADEILVLWVGRLSFYEKAFPGPMFEAVQRAARASGVPMHFALAGWFPTEEDRGRYEESARDHAPDVNVHFLNGNDRSLLGELWAAADIFLSLVDNIQETFGITPLEAMAAGLPVVASDWDGYRSTVRDGVDGFLIPTLGGPTSGLGATMITRHLFETVSYQAYVGEVAQYTAVHIGRAAEALAQLAKSPDLRKRMGAAGRERIRTAFDWPIVARQVHELVDELAAIRAASPDPVVRQAADPVRGDPFVAFMGFPNQILTPDTVLSAAPGVTGEAVLGLTGALDVAFTGLRGSLEECAEALDLLASGKAATVRDVLLAFPMPRRRLIQMGLSWMAKLGLIDWLA